MCGYQPSHSSNNMPPTTYVYNIKQISNCQHLVEVYKKARKIKR